MFRSNAFLIVFLISLVWGSVSAQECKPPTIVANDNSKNLFTAEQETVLGYVTLQQIAGDVRMFRDPALVAYIEGIGSRLVANLPETGLKFTFHIIDLPEANAFNIPGGHVLVSRKLIGFAASEDELAGVIAHELGHAVVHHAAIDISADMRKILGVTSLGGTKDVEEQYNRLIEKYRTKRSSRSQDHGNDQQMEADKIGLFSMTAAGYDPEAFTSFFDRLVETEGKTGSWFSDFFGRTRPEEKRLREMVSATSQLPASCRVRRDSGVSAQFLKFQAEVVSYRYSSRKEDLPGLGFKRELAPKLRSDINNLEFSSDGRYLLAQDDFSIVVMRRDPFEVLFQIPVEGARDARFTPDNRDVVFVTSNSRFERWNVGSRSPVAIRELVLRTNCWEQRLSPDGKFLACVDTAANMILFDVDSGKKVWDKSDFFSPDFLRSFNYLRSIYGIEYDDNHLFRIEFSPDSRYVVYSRTNQFQSVIVRNGVRMVDRVNSVFAVDTQKLKPLDLGGNMTNLAVRPFAFLDSERILAMPSDDTEDSGIFSFPEGKRLEKFAIGAESIEPTANANYILLKPIPKAKLGIFDLRTRSIVSGLDKNDAAIWKNIIAFESVSGKLVLREIAYVEAEKRLEAKEIGALDIPAGPLGSLQAAAVSDNFDWMLISGKSRGGVWNLSTGERKIQVRGFRDGLIVDNGVALSEFEKLGETPHGLSLLNPADGTVQPFRELDQFGARQYGRFVLTKTNLKPPKSDSGDAEKDAVQDEAKAREIAEWRLFRDVRWELKDILKDQVVWTREFEGYAPRLDFDQYSGRLITYRWMAYESTKAILKARPELAERAKRLADKEFSYLIEVNDAFRQKEVGTVLIDIGIRSYGIGYGSSEGDWLLFHDTEGRVLLYSLTSGELVHRFFGRNGVLSPSRALVAVESFPGEISIRDLQSGEIRGKVLIDSESAFIRFSLDGSRMIVLSQAQSVYVFEVDKVTAAYKPS